MHKAYTIILIKVILLCFSFILCANTSAYSYSETRYITPKHCWSKNVKETCEFYSQCLEHSFSCNSTPYKYPISEGHKFCPMFRELKTSLSNQGDNWVDNTTTCLTGILKDKYFSQPSTSQARNILDHKRFYGLNIDRPKICKQIQDTAFSSHSVCYTDNFKGGICDLPYRDLFEIFKKGLPQIGKNTRQYTTEVLVVVGFCESHLRKQKTKKSSYQNKISNDASRKIQFFRDQKKELIKRLSSEQVLGSSRFAEKINAPHFIAMEYPQPKGTIEIKEGEEYELSSSQIYSVEKLILGNNSKIRLTEQSDLRIFALEAKIGKGVKIIGMPTNASSVINSPPTPRQAGTGILGYKGKDGRAGASGLWGSRVELFIGIGNDFGSMHFDLPGGNGGMGQAGGRGGRGGGGDCSEHIHPRAGGSGGNGGQNGYGGDGGIVMFNWWNVEKEGLNYDVKDKLTFRLDGGKSGGWARSCIPSIRCKPAFNISGEGAPKHKYCSGIYRRTECKMGSLCHETSGLFCSKTEALSYGGGPGINEPTRDCLIGDLDTKGGFPSVGHRGIPGKNGEDGKYHLKEIPAPLE